MKKIILGTIGFLLLMAVNADAKVLIDESSKNMSPDSVEKSAFSGLKVEGLEQIPTYGMYPFTDFVVKFFPEVSEKLYEGGDTVSVKGSITLKGNEEKELQKLIEDCKKDVTTINLEGEEGVESSQFEYKKGCSFPQYSVVEITDLGIYVQVWRKDSTENSKIGDYLIDEFYVSEGMTLLKNKDESFNIEWKVPANEKGGNYYFAVFIDSNSRYGLKGLSVVPNDFAEVYPFAVKENQEGIVEIDKNNMLVNGQKYIHRSPAPVLEPQDGALNVEIPIVNSSALQKNVKVAYEVTRWKQDDSEDNVISDEEEVTIQPGDTLKYPIKIDTSDILTSLYHLRVKIDSGDNTSACNMHLVMKDRARGLLVFLGLGENQSNTRTPLFCMRNRNWLGSFEGSVELSLLGKGGKEISKWSESGFIKSQVNCYAVTQEDMQIGKGECITIAGKIIDKNDEVVDKGTVEYGCKPSEVQKGEEALYDEIDKLKDGSSKYLILVVLILATLFGGITLLVINKFKNKS